MRRFFSKLVNVVKPANTARATRRDARRAHLRVEALEERQLLTVSGLPLLTPIAAEYAVTASEKDAFGNNVQVLLGAATSGVTSVLAKRPRTEPMATLSTPIWWSFKVSNPRTTAVLTAPMTAPVKATGSLSARRPHRINRRCSRSTSCSGRCTARS